MAPSILFLLLLSAISAATSQLTTQSNINLGSSLSPTKNPSSWLSPSGRFAFGFYPKGDGFAVGVWLITKKSNKTVVWTMNRDDPPISSDSILLLRDDGNLVLQSEHAKLKLISNAPASWASMLDSGNFVLYNSLSKIIWESFSTPTDTILSGQHLLSGTQLFSSVSESDHSTGRFRLNMQTDGNLVLYPVETSDTWQHSYWSSNTDNQGYNVTLNLDKDGVLYLLNRTGFNVYNLTQAGYSRNGSYIYRATLDFDGILRLYRYGFEDNGTSTVSMAWEAVDDKCSVKGVCGLNAFCLLLGDKPDCRCPDGFNFVDPPEKAFRGCERDFVAEVCGSRRNNTQYSISVLENTFWSDVPSYETSFKVSKEDCKHSCLQDCYCEAATFDGGRCAKQKLPLRYGRINSSYTATAFFKINNASATTSTDSNPRAGAAAVNGNKKELRMEIFIPGVVFVALSCISTAVSGFLVYRHRLWMYIKKPKQDSFGLTEEISLRSFSFGELEKATDGFKQELGRGAFGTVFKGALFSNKRVVAVKRLDRVAKEGEREFQAEIRVIGRTYHKNLVQLLGFCDNGINKLLVYEYMSNGSLADLLFSPERRPIWNDRMGIALDVARGILYLHEECETQIIHCDIKPQNILMNEYYIAKISDFGLAKLMKADQTKTSTGIRGTRGYLAPEWHKNMPITVKADVYSYGILLLEVICCRRSVEIETEEEEMILTNWVYDCFEEGELRKLVKGEEVDERKLERMAKVGLWCIQDEPSLRPSMKKVVLMLEGTLEVPIPPTPTSLAPSRKGLKSRTIPRRIARYVSVSETNDANPGFIIDDTN